MRARSIVAPLALMASAVACGRLAPEDAQRGTEGAPNDAPVTDVAPAPKTTTPPEEKAVDTTHARWMAYSTFVSSASTQTLLYLVDLAHPDRAPVEVERQSATNVTSSPDGHWLFYQSYRGTNDVRLYVVDVSGDAPGAPVLLVKSAAARPCAWAPDSKKLACVRQSGTDASAAASVIAFDMSGAMPSAATEIGSFASQVHPLDGVFWSDAKTLVFPGDGTLRKVTWTGGTTTTRDFGAPGGAIVRLSPDGHRALVTGIRDYDPAALGGENPSFRIADLEAETSFALDAHASWSFSSGLDTAIALEPGSRLYYRISGSQAASVATVASEDTPTPWSREWQRSLDRDPWLGSRRIELHDGHPTSITIGDVGIAEEIVPGDVTSIRHLEASPDGTLLYIESALLDDQNRAIDASATHWLSRFVDGHPQPAVQFASGFATGDYRSISFSPSSKRLLLHGDNGYFQAPNAPVAFRIYDLSASTIRERNLDLTLKWGVSEWSQDSSYLSVIGALQERTAFVIDIADPKVASRALFTCSSNPAPIPGCPNYATF